MNETQIDNEELEDNEAETKNEDYFKVIGDKKKKEHSKSHSILPNWTYDAASFSGDIQNNSVVLSEFESLIHPNLIKNLQQSNIKKLFPVQKEVVPKLVTSLKQMKYFRPNDISVISPTGSGKTFAYAIPVINYLMNRIVTQIRVLIILPVFDLAVQVYKVFKSLCSNTTIRAGLAQQSSTYYQIKGNQSLCLMDILIATPGILMDLINKNSDEFNLNYLEVLIIDEADRMMNETQFQWLKSIEYSVYGSNEKYYCSCLVKNFQLEKNYNIDSLCACSIFNQNNSSKTIFKILFSATFSTDLEKIDNLSLYNPVLLNFNLENITNSKPKQIIPENLKEMMIINDKDKKPLILWYLVKNLQYKRILCFTNSILNAHRLFKLLKLLPELVVREFHSKQDMRQRSKTLKKFENGLIHILVSTDITARGIDIDGIDCVINYDVPRNDTAYIHRIGRTARAGKQGTAITLISPEQLKHLNIILRRAHKDSPKHIEKFPVKKSDLKELIPIYQNALKQLEKTIRKEQTMDKKTFR